MINIEIDRDKMPERIFAVLVGYESFKNRLDGVLYRRYRDFAVTLRWRVTVDDMEGNVILTEQLVREMGYSEDELFDAAIRNSERMFPAVVRPLYDVVNELHGMCGGDTDECECGVPEVLYISNSRGCYGATTLLYGDLLSRIYDRLQGDFYILPSSINEVLAVPVSGCECGVDELKTMVHDVNMACVNESELLSYSVYVYHGETGELEVAA